MVYRPEPETYPPTKRTLTQDEKFNKHVEMMSPTIKRNGKIFHDGCLGCENELIKTCKRCRYHDFGNTISLPNLNTEDGEISMKHQLLTPKGYEVIDNYGIYDSPNKSNQSFDSIIMECQDMLSIEDKVQEKYEEWLGGEKKPPELVLDLTCSEQFKTGLRKSLKLFFIPIAMIPTLLIYNHISYMLFVGFINVLNGFTYGFDALYHWNEWKIKIVKGSKKSKHSESSKFQFLKESYSGTINNLNERLELVQNRISEQIKVHRHDREQIQEYSDLLGDTSEAINKIHHALRDLHKSSKKLSEKKVEINKSLNEYIGESGVIAQKEKEIERLKIAQELSDRMKTNFHTTMEITKSVDVLTDVIIPGLKQLMSLKIPELIEKVNFECDKERVLLEIKR